LVLNLGLSIGALFFWCRSVDETLRSFETINPVVELYFQETFTFRLLTTEAAVVLAQRKWMLGAAVPDKVFLEEARNLKDG